MADAERPSGKRPVLLSSLPCRYTLEFYCPAVYLAVELYNETDSSDIPDAEREEYLEDCYGIRIIRFGRQEVLDEPSHVQNEIVRQVEGRMFCEEEPKPHS